MKLANTVALMAVLAASVDAEGLRVRKINILKMSLLIVVLLIRAWYYTAPTLTIAIRALCLRYICGVYGRRAFVVRGGHIINNYLKNSLFLLQ